MTFAPASLRIVSLTGLLVYATVGFGQDLASASAGPSISRVDLAGAYDYFKPFDSAIKNIPYQTIVGGGVFSGAYYFKPRLGIQVEGNYQPNDSTDNNCVYTAQAGPIFRVQKGRFIPFVHVLVGGAEVGGPAGNKCATWGYGGTGGGGLDYVLPIFHNHLAVRAIQADMTYAHVDYPQPAVANPALGGVGDVYALRLSAGLVFRFGSMSGPGGKVIPSLDCSANPGDPYAGDAVTIVGTMSNLRSDKDTEYHWETSAGRIVGRGATAVVDTTGLNPGSYTVSGHLVHIAKQREIASCTTSFTIRRLDPPTVACAVNRAAINSGDPVMVTATAMSPQNRPLTYSYTTTSGVITPSGATATLTTVGATPGTITVTCSVADDRSLGASATASVVVAIPAPPPTPKAMIEPLCSLSFDRDRKRPDRVDNESKACLDDVALNLNRLPDAKLLLIGNHDSAETNSNAAERALNAAQYLTDEKGIDPSRLELRVGPDGTRSVSTVLVPPGAAVDASIGQSFDTSSVKRTGQAYGKARVVTAPKKRRKKKVVVPPPPVF